MQKYFYLGSPLRYSLNDIHHGILPLKLRSSRAESNWPLRATATVGQNSNSVQMAFAYHVSAAVLAHVALSGQLDSALDERSLKNIFNTEK